MVIFTKIRTIFVDLMKDCDGFKLQRSKLAYTITYLNSSCGRSITINREHLIMKAKTGNGSGYAIVHKEPLWKISEHVMKRLIEQLVSKTFADSDMIIENKKYSFDLPSFTANNSGRVYSTSQIGSVKVIGVATVKDGGRVLTELGPDDTPWFLLDCYGKAGATFNIITDGEEFCFISRMTLANVKTRIKIINDCPKATVSGTSFTQFDKEMVRKAIDIYVAGGVIEKDVSPAV